MALGPIQFVVFGVRTEEQQNEVARDLRALSEKGTIRVIDLAYIRKTEEGGLVPGRMSGLTEEEQRRYGAVAHALIGMGAKAETAKITGEVGMGAFAEQDFGLSVQELKEQINDLTHDLPTGGAIAIALIEHRWVLQLRENVQKAGVVVMAQGMVRPRSLIMLGAELAAAEQAAH